jgi:hypothetical protein
MSKPQSVYKIVLSTGKEVLLRELQIGHQELAMRNAAQRAGDNPMLLMAMTQKEMIKILLVQVNGKPVGAKEAEDLDGLFSFPEYLQVQQVVGKLQGADEKIQPKIEFASIGE